MGKSSILQFGICLAAVLTSYPCIGFCVIVLCCLCWGFVCRDHREGRKRRQLVPYCDERLECEGGGGGGGETTRLPFCNDLDSDDDDDNDWSPTTKRRIPVVSDAETDGGDEVDTLILANNESEDEKSDGSYEEQLDAPLWEEEEALLESQEYSSQMVQFYNSPWSDLTDLSCIPANPDYHDFFDPVSSYFRNVSCLRMPLLSPLFVHFT